MSALTRGLSIAIGKAALAKHRETCDRCTTDSPCVVAQAHLNTLADLEGGDQ